jgi:ATP-dependent Clp protease protease subunit
MELVLGKADDDKGLWEGFYGPESRAILISGPITEDSAEEFCEQVLELESLSSNPIYIHINTPGGSVIDALAMYDTLRMVKCPVVTIIRGLCGSAGNLILAAGDRRLTTASSVFFYHQMQMGWLTISSNEDLEGHTKVYQTLSNIFNDHLKDRFGHSEEEWRREFDNKTSKWFTAKDALAYGWVQEIIKPANKVMK